LLLNFALKHLARNALARDGLDSTMESWHPKPESKVIDDLTDRCMSGSEMLFGDDEVRDMAS